MLTDPEVRKAVPRERDYKIPDSGGLYLFVTKAGHKSWRLNTASEARSGGSCLGRIQTFR